MGRKRNSRIIETPERIEFRFAVAHTGARMGAWFLDSLLQISVLSLLFLLLSSTGLGTFGGVSSLNTAVTFLVIFALQWGYFTLFEWFWAGQTPGKKALGLRVINGDGSPLDISTLVLRNFLRVVDMFPVIPLIGGAVSLLHPESRRLGDLVADTLVIRNSREKLYIPKAGLWIPDHQGVSRPLIQPADNRRLNENHLDLVAEFLSLHYQGSKQVSLYQARELARLAASELGMDHDAAVNPVEFLEELFIYYAVPEQN